MENQKDYQFSKLSNLEYESLRECGEFSRIRREISTNFRLQDSCYNLNNIRNKIRV